MLLSIDAEPIHCDFEGVEPCPLMSNTSQPEEWNLVTGTESSPGVQDHTLAVVNGHYMYMLASDRRTNYTARLYTDFIDTHNKCLLLFYKFSGKGNAKISVYVVQENLQEILVDNRVYTESTPLWIPLHTKLPSGIHQVVIEGWRGTGDPGIAVDDFSLHSCSSLGEFFVALGN